MNTQDPDLDSIDCDPGSEIPSTPFQAEVVALEFGSPVTNESFYPSGPYGLVESTL